MHTAAFLQWISIAQTNNIAIIKRDLFEIQVKVNQLDATASRFFNYYYYYYCLNNMLKDALGIDSQANDIEAANACLQFPGK